MKQSVILLGMISFAICSCTGSGPSNKSSRYSSFYSDEQSVSAKSQIGSLSFPLLKSQALARIGLDQKKLLLLRGNISSSSSGTELKISYRISKSYLAAIAAYNQSNWDGALKDGSIDRIVIGKMDDGDLKSLLGPETVQMIQTKIEAVDSGKCEVKETPDGLVTNY